MYINRLINTYIQVDNEHINESNLNAKCIDD